MAFTAVLDACVLYPAPLRDLLLNLAEAGLYRAKWTEQIQEEWTRNLLEDRPDLSKEKLERTCQLMNKSILDCLVTSYEDLVDSLNLRDPDDRHVLAAAVRSNADIIVTLNLKDFDDAELTKYEVRTEHPDEFISNMIEIYTPEVLDVVREQRANLTKPPVSKEDFLLRLSGQGLPQTVNKLSEFLGAI